MESKIQNHLVERFVLLECEDHVVNMVSDSLTRQHEITLRQMSDVTEHKTQINAFGFVTSIMKLISDMIERIFKKECKQAKSFKFAPRTHKAPYEPEPQYNPPSCGC